MIADKRLDGSDKTLAPLSRNRDHEVVSALYLGHFAASHKNIHAHCIGPWQKSDCIVVLFGNKCQRKLPHEHLNRQ